MENISLDMVKDCSAVYCDEKNVLLLGRYLWVFRTDGTFVCRNKEMRNAYKAVCLPGNMALIHIEHKQRYYYLSLETGDIVWSCGEKCKRLMSAERFTRSPDGLVVYDNYYDLNGLFHIIRIEPSKQLHTICTVSDTLRTVCGSYCDEQGALHVMQTQVMSDEDPRYAHEKPSLYGILRIELENDPPMSTWVSQWTGASRPKPCGCDARYTLYGDLRVHDRITNQWIDLLANDIGPRPSRNMAIIWNYDQQHSYLTVSYLGTLMTVVVDCKAQRRVAQYEREEFDLGSTGALINGEFWTGTKSGVVKLPFPHMNEVGYRYFN